VMALLTNTTPRWVEKPAHDGSYEGVTRTVSEFIKQGITDDVHVFVRETEKPKRIYTTEGRQHRDALAAIEYGRESGRKKAVTEFPTKYEIVKEVLKEKKPDLIERLEDWLSLYNDEVEHFSKLERGSDYSD
ncbi:MAG: hypothetical protein ACI4VQ_02010, partial [Clostridia bacterium]